MESNNQVTDIARPNVYMASIDLKDAFYSIPIHPEDKKYSKCVVLSNIYQYTCMPDGGPAMRIFAKLSNIPFSHLLSKVFVSAVFVEDSYLQDNTNETCLHNIESLIELLQNLGFTMNPSKSSSNEPRNNSREKEQDS